MAAKGLAKLIEECGELLQVAGKKLEYYHTDMHPDRRGSLSDRLEDEIADVYAAATFVIELMGLNAHAIAVRSAEKLERFRTWHADASNNTDGIDSFEHCFSGVTSKDITDTGIFVFKEGSPAGVSRFETAMQRAALLLKGRGS